MTRPSSITWGPINTHSYSLLTSTVLTHFSHYGSHTEDSCNPASRFKAHASKQISRDSQMTQSPAHTDVWKAFSVSENKASCPVSHPWAASVDFFYCPNYILTAYFNRTPFDLYNSHPRAPKHIFLPTTTPQKYKQKQRRIQIAMSTHGGGNP